MDQSIYYILATLIGGSALTLTGLSYLNTKKTREDSKSASELKYKPSIETTFELGRYNKSLFEFSPKLTIHNTGETSLTISELLIYGDILLSNKDKAKYLSPDKAEQVIVLRADESKDVNFNIHLNGSNTQGIKLFLELTAKNNKGNYLNIKGKQLTSETFVARDFL
ncbi:hypothetical protein ACPV3O_23605 [Vibrio rotiferianus]|uniref:hypothetical protein n=1 Tax=Vibrio rotiferianus TaxID=190895 RepID=UPI00406A551D